MATIASARDLQLSRELAAGRWLIIVEFEYAPSTKTPRLPQSFISGIKETFFYSSSTYSASRYQPQVPPKL